MPARHHLQQVIESAIDFAIVVTDRDGVITDWNKGAELILGWRSEDIVGASVALPTSATSAVCPADRSASASGR